jgi:anti-anti-sigma regulatory factor
MTHFSLPADCTVGRIRELKAALAVEFAAASPSMTLTASAVERCDATLLQLLVALQRALAGASGTLRIEHASTIVRETASALGMSDLLGPRMEHVEDARP